MHLEGKGVVQTSQRSEKHSHVRLGVSEMFQQGETTQATKFFKKAPYQTHTQLLGSTSMLLSEEFFFFFIFLPGKS